MIDASQVDQSMFDVSPINRGIRPSNVDILDFGAAAEDTSFNNQERETFSQMPPSSNVDG